MAESTAIPKLTTAVFDTGRRGNPKPGCDCVQCFGYCLSDRDKAQRDMAQRSAGVPVIAVLGLDR